MKLVTSLLLLIPFTAQAYSLSGNFKSYPILKDMVNRTEVDKSWQNSGKIQFQDSYFEKLKVEAAYELTAIYEKRPNLPLTPIKSNYRIKDLDYYLSEQDNDGHYGMSLVQNLNRFNIGYAFTYGDVIAGRQPIAFGSAKSINPTDVLAPFAINTIDKEERTGVDAIVAKVPVKENILLEVGTVAGEKYKNENSAYYVRPKFNFNQYDINLTLMKFKKNDLIGFDIQHPISDAGFWLEAAYVNQDKAYLKDFFRATTGVDYKFQSTLYLSLEYHYNGASLNNHYYPADYIYLRDYHYAIGTMTYEFTPLLTGTTQTYYNVQHGSVFSGLKLDYNLTDNSYLGLGSYLGIGDKVNTEFGRYGKVYYSSFRYYF